MTFQQILLRAVKTAVQTFGGSMGAVTLGWIDGDLVKSSILAGTVAGISVIWNAIMSWAQQGDE